MKVREAVTKAKDYIRDVYTDEGIRFVGLEEVEFDDKGRDHAWRITIGFARPWDCPPTNVLQEALNQMAMVRRPPPRPPIPRTYKLVVLRDADGKILAVKNRDPAA